MTNGTTTPLSENLVDRHFVGGYLSEMAAHQLAAGPFPPSLQDVQVLNAAAKMLLEAVAPHSENALTIPEGWKLVPVEPTPGMTEAGDLFFTNQSFKNVSPAQIKRIYGDMLAAAPEAPKPTASECICPNCGIRHGGGNAKGDF